MKFKPWAKIYKGSDKSKLENNDCFIRSVAETFNVEYDESHAFVEKHFNRRKRNGTEFNVSTIRTLIENKHKIGGYEFELLPIDEITYYGGKNKIGLLIDEEKELFKMTVGMFVRKNKSGRYIIIVNGHAFSYVDGVIIGNPDDAIKLKKRIIHVIKTKNP
jgi:hypothetical protein